VLKIQGRFLPRFRPFIYGHSTSTGCPGRSSAASVTIANGLARDRLAAYAGSVVKTPFVNVEEKIDRFVGRRTQVADALSTKYSNKADARAWQKALGGIRVPRGVYRFKTHEEADEWLWRMICRPTN
jgi:hypothetical protein